MVFDYDADAAPARRAAEYRNEAAMMRSLAQEMRFAENRVRLLVLADSFDMLADQVEDVATRTPLGV
jgi:hypothetical protein